MGNLPKRIDPPERWRPVRGFEGRYEVSSEGRVRKAWTGARKPLLLKAYRKRNYDRQLHVTLFRSDGSYCKRPVLKLVAEAFLDMPEGMRAVHKNGMVYDNRVGNIALMTDRDIGRNIAWKFKRRPVIKINRAGEIVECYCSAREAGRRDYLTATCVTARCNGQVADEFRLTGYSYRWDDGL